MNESDFRLPISSIRKDNQPLVLTSQSHPGYIPVKLNVKTAFEMKSNKSKAPEKPIPPYMRYSRKVWDSVKVSHPEAKLWEIGKIIAQMWKDLGEIEKQEYIYEYENAKLEYCEQLKIYHNSPQYQSFLSNISKKKFKSQVEDFKPNNIGSNNSITSNTNNNINNNINNKLTINSSDGSLSHYAIEAAEDDGIDDGLSLRHISLARFNRNHRLLNEIFNEYLVPDNRAIITSQRIDQLKKQVNSLELHEEKLKQELQVIEEKFELKKRKILDSSNEYHNELKKLCEFSISEEQLKSFFNKNYDQLKNQDKENLERISFQSLNNAFSSLQVVSPVNIVAIQQVIEANSNNIQNQANSNSASINLPNNASSQIYNSSVINPNSSNPQNTPIPNQQNQTFSQYQNHQNNLFLHQAIQHQPSIQNQSQPVTNQQQQIQSNLNNIIPHHHSSQQTPNQINLQITSSTSQSNHLGSSLHSNQSSVLNNQQQSNLQPTQISQEYSYASHSGYSQAFNPQLNSTSIASVDIQSQLNNSFPNQVYGPQASNQFSIQQQNYQIQRANLNNSYITNSNSRFNTPLNQLNQVQNINMMSANRPSFNTSNPTSSPQIQTLIHSNSTIINSNQNPNYQNFISGNNQFSQTTQQQYSSSNTPPINNTTNIVSPPQHIQQQTSSAVTNSVINGLPQHQLQAQSQQTQNHSQQQQIINNVATSSIQSPIINRVQNSSMQSQIIRNNSHSQISQQNINCLQQTQQQQQSSQLNQYNSQNITPSQNQSCNSLQIQNQINQSINSPISSSQQNTQVFNVNSANPNTQIVNQASIYHQNQSNLIYTMSQQQQNQQQIFQQSQQQLLNNQYGIYQANVNNNTGQSQNQPVQISISSPNQTDQQIQNTPVLQTDSKQSKGKKKGKTSKNNNTNSSTD